MEGGTAMARRLRYMAVALALAGTLGGCETATAIPAGAQQVHVDATGATVRLDPTTVRAGEVYLVVELPASGASFAILDESGAPFTDADLARLAQGDEQGLRVIGIDNSCCGNVHKETLSAGKYAFVLHADSIGPGVPPPPVTVLDVTP
jgi:hypothetical protein